MAKEKKPSNKPLAGCAIVAVGFLFIIIILVIALPSSDSDSSSSNYAGGLSACYEFQRILAPISEGIITDAELRDKLKKIQGRGSTAEPDIRAASTLMLRASTQGDIDALLTGLTAMGQACSDAGYPGK